MREEQRQDLPGESSSPSTIVDKKVCISSGTKVEIES